MNGFRIFVDFAVTPEVLELLQAGTCGHQLVFPKTPVSSVLARAERDPQFTTVDIAFGQPEPGAIAEAGQLKWIHISTSGITRYDNPQFRALMAERKIPVTNSASVYNEACAVHALSFMLAQARKLPQALRCRTGNGSKAWLEIRGSSGTLRGETVLILGYGAIGKRLAELLRPFDMNMMAYRRKPRGDEGVPVITEEQLAEALAQADHIVNILPDSAATRHFFDAARFAMIKPGAIFYNIGRGTTVNQDALLEALRSGHFAAAWLDVTEPEPLPPEHPLRAEPNCFITPHVAGGHAGETKTLVRHFLKNFDRFVRGEPLLDRVM
ncbi:MAG TPA: D-2-hydroxyacid dehydrogenase [Candidatus Acidoferrales bacterium]|nr:D-2-hydroxyacid dehydrogenase [Candidatus Acidoferrales bacterium]